ncbi:RodZ domain-containing protein [Deinococcus sp.]|uniref:RodZ domain-containing protein n=1 Tax=Deinococcus sp. TaxID=47478 RepID=UPI003C7C8094
MSFGNELKAAREAQGLSIQDVAGRIKVRGDYLRALEAEELKALPERTFARAYVQSYARALGLDAAPLLRDFDRLLPKPAEQVNNLKKPGKDLPATRRGAGASGLVGWLLGGALLVAVAGYFGYSAYRSRSTLPATAQNTAAPSSARQVKFSLSSTPSGARVYLDNRYLGLTPIPNFPLDARPQAALRVEYGGRQSYREHLNLENDRNLSISLTPLTAQQLAAQQLAAQATAAAAAKRAAQQSALAAAQGSTQTQVAQTQTIQTQATQTQATQPPQPPGAQAAPTPPTATAAQAAPASGVRLNWTGTSWIRVTTASGQLLYEGTPAAGSSRDFPSGVTVRAGSAGMVTATVSGGQPQKLGSVGAVVTRTF